MPGSPPLPCKCSSLCRCVAAPLMDVLTWGMTCPPIFPCLTAAPCPCSDACAALLSAPLGKASVSKAGHKNHPAFRWSSFSPARALGRQGKGKQQVHNRAPGMPNAGLEPLCKQTEMQTQSTSPAAPPALGAGLDKAGMHSPAVWQSVGSAAGSGQPLWQRLERHERPQGSREVEDLC